MSRPLRATPWLFAMAAVAAGASAFVTEFRGGPLWQVVVLLAGAVASFIAWREYRMPSIFMVAIAVATARLMGVHPHQPNASLHDLRWHHVLSDIGVGIALTSLLATVLWRRHGRLRFRDAVDISTVAAGSAMVAWVVVARPLIQEHDVSTGLAMATATYFPLAALLMTFTLDLTFNGLGRNRTMYFVTVASIVNVVAALTSQLHVVDALPVGQHDVGDALYLAAFLLMCGGLSHRDAPGTLEHVAESSELRADTSVRLLIMGVSVLAPAALIAAVAPSSTIDVLVRTCGTALLVIMVVSRLRIATRDHAVAQQELLWKLHRDELTGLPTRSRFVECVDDALETTWRTEHHPTIIQLNLDRFKNINDSLGHYDANRVLVLVSERLREAAEAFGGTVARSGGDDFVVVDASTKTPDDAMRRSAAIRDSLASPISVADSTVFVTASIGVAIAPRNRTISAEELMRRADIATHRAKADGRNRVALFDDSMQAHLTRRMDVEQALHGAIGRQEMRLYHQPIVDIVTGRVSGFEALMRWQRSDGTIVSPADFIPIAEETGIICELGAWALEDALRELRGWIDDGVVPATATVSVNVSPRQIADPKFAEIVRDVLARSGVSSQLLWLEMTESMMLEEPDLAQTTLREIRSMGVRLALDDFGTGFSSLSLLQQFPIQRIKIDRAFVQGMAEHGNDRSLVRTIIAMAQTMDLDLVAEGVETVHQLQGLRELGCGKAQGYLISHPVPADAMRSTMVALDELASLSLFGPVDLDIDVGSIAPASSDTVYAPSISSPMGAMISRPLGQPMI